MFDLEVAGDADALEVGLAGHEDQSGVGIETWPSGVDDEEVGLLARVRASLARRRHPGTRRCRRCGGEGRRATPGGVFGPVGGWRRGRSV